MKVLENRIYRHFKGNNYKVLCVAMHTETAREDGSLSSIIWGL